MLNCPCCWAPVYSTGGCTECLNTIWCHCGARFCTAHHAAAAAEHIEKCRTYGNLGGSSNNGGPTFLMAVVPNEFTTTSVGNAWD